MVTERMAAMNKERACRVKSIERPMASCTSAPNNPPVVDHSVQVIDRYRVTLINWGEPTGYQPYSFAARVIALRCLPVSRERVAFDRLRGCIVLRKTISRNSTSDLPRNSRFTLQQHEDNKPSLALCHWRTTKHEMIQDQK